MISEASKNKIISLAKKYKASKIVLFGSSLDKAEKEAADLDLGVEGVSPSEFYRFYGELIFGLAKPVDVVNLSNKSKFTRIILKEGAVLYGAS